MKTLRDENIEVLQQGITLLQRLSQAQFRQKLPVCFNASIGGHIRHNIDHYLSFLSGFPTGKIDYERRERDPGIETNRDFAVEMLREISRLMAGLPSEDKRLLIRAENTDENDRAAWGFSTGRRELQFLLSHTIHHYALVAVSCRLLDVEPHSDFGVAPSTLRYREALNAKVA